MRQGSRKAVFQTACGSAYCPKKGNAFWEHSNDMKPADGQMGEAHSKVSTLPHSSRRLSTPHTLTCCSPGIDAALPAVLQVKRWAYGKARPPAPAEKW